MSSWPGDMTEAHSTFGSQPLLVLALGGNALSPPATAGDDYPVEREIVGRTAVLLDTLANAGYRLLIVHGNGPQVGRLLRQDPAHGSLDIHIAQTQGELGYLLESAMREPAVCLLTRVIVHADAGPPVKPIGPVLETRPKEPATPSGKGWRLIVPSPRPLEVVELPAIEALLERQHVIAAGGGGIPQNESGAVVRGVVDKDWTAALLAIRLDAACLVFATDVTGVFAEPGMQSGAPLASLDLETARSLIQRGVAEPGSMAPKLESAAEFAAATGRSAHICALDDIEGAMAGEAGTRIG
jgi:carbamate kinase